MHTLATRSPQPPSMLEVLAVFPDVRNTPVATLRRRFRMTHHTAQAVWRQALQYQVRQEAAERAAGPPPEVRALMDEHRFSESEARYVLTTFGRRL